MNPTNRCDYAHPLAADSFNRCALPAGHAGDHRSLLSLEDSNEVGLDCVEVRAVHPDTKEGYAGEERILAADETFLHHEDREGLCRHCRGRKRWVRGIGVGYWRYYNTDKNCSIDIRVRAKTLGEAKKLATKRFMKKLRRKHLNLYYLELGL